MKAAIKRLCMQIAPQWTTALQSSRARAYSQRVIAGWGCDRLNTRLADEFGMKVMEGPFQGMKLTSDALREQFGPYLFGVYESELDLVWSSLSQFSYSQIVDIGSKFGYYAVGLARRYPDADVIAFDTDWWARVATRRMAQLNGTERVTVRSFCSSDWIRKQIRPGSLILSDCEGFEVSLFTDLTLPYLKDSTLIIETHDCFVPGVSERLKNLFQETHHVTWVGHEADRRKPNVNLDLYEPEERRLAVEEVRSEQVWLVCRPHHNLLIENKDGLSNLGLTAPDASPNTGKT